jgi:hypothetical protein
MATKTAKVVPTGVRYFIDLLQTDELVALYKHFSGVKQIRFPDRQTAEERCINICFSQPHFKMVEALKSIGLPEGTWSQYGTQLRGPLLAPQGPIKPEDLKRHQKALAADRKKPDWRDTTDKPLDTATLAILKTIREMMPEELKDGEPPQVNSTDVAKKLDTNVNAICAAADKLAKRELIKVEDDSNDAHKFYWIELLPAGREFNLTAPPVVVQKKLPAAGPGPRSGYSGKFIYKLVDKNPRREGTHGFKGFEIYEDGMPYEKFRDKGGRNNDLQWDIDKKFIELRTSNEGGPSVKHKPKEEPKTSKPPTTKKENVKAELAKLKAQLAAQEATKPAGAVPNGNGRAVPKGSTGAGSKRSVAPRGGKVLRKSKPVRRSK